MRGLGKTTPKGMWPLRPAGKGARSEQVAQTLKDEAIWLDRFGLCEHWREITVPHVFQIEGYVFFPFLGGGGGGGGTSYLFGLLGQILAKQL